MKNVMEQIQYVGMGVVLVQQILKNLIWMKQKLFVDLVIRGKKLFKNKIYFSKKRQAKLEIAVKEIVNLPCFVEMESVNVGVEV